jgi:acetylornithine deacetylase
METPEAVERLVAELVAIDSVNPALVPGGAGEEEVAAFVARWLTEAGLEVEVVQAGTGRPPPACSPRRRWSTPASPVT